MPRLLPSAPGACAAAVLALALVGLGAVRPAHAQPLPLQPCRLKGVEHEALCGQVKRALDPARPQGVLIDIHYAVLPALARRKHADPVFFFAGGPGQSAIELAGPLSRRHARLGQRRDLVFVDQRGTGRSAPLKCADDDERAALRPLVETADEARRLRRLRECAAALRALPHGDLRQYTTSIAVADVDAVRAALGVERFNAIAMSYGTRVVLEFQRQFPQRLRRAVLDGVAPPDMVLPAASSPDSQAALDAVFDGCEAEVACVLRYPRLRERWRSLLASLPVAAEVRHPLTGQAERITITADLLLGAVRAPLYAPALAAGLPAALDEATRRRFGALLGLGAALAGPGGGLASGMHFSVVCAEDMPLLAQSADAPARDFGRHLADLYREVCADWPAGRAPVEFHRVGTTATATWVLSGGADPATPPRHGERVVAALGPLARHGVVPQAGHGVLGLACVRDAVQRFIEAPDDAQALAVDATCASTIPRPPAFVPVGSVSGASQ